MGDTSNSAYLFTMETKQKQKQGLRDGCLVFLSGHSSLRNKTLKVSLVIWVYVVDSAEYLSGPWFPLYSEETSVMVCFLCLCSIPWSITWGSSRNLPQSWMCGHSRRGREMAAKMQNVPGCPVAVRSRYGKPTGLYPAFHQESECY